ncbi:MAG TPA: helix-turn-helix domain-containing protein [Desulfuromonadales bacterium]|nr:helix-turn-helix domain-containing protein [Desulfuromonadales bacterium]
MNTSILTANNIIDMRNKMGLSRDDLANMLGVSSKTVARWENQNNNEPPSGTAAIVLSTIISNALNIPLQDGKPELISEMESIHEKSKIRENPDTIFSLLDQAANEEKAEICKALKLPVDSDVYQISKEYRSAAGHTIGNWFRGDHDMPYKEILADIANKLKPKKDKSVYLLGDGRSEEDIENKIVDYFAIKIADELNRLKPEERAQKLVEIQKSLNEGKNPDVHIESIKEIEKVLSATTVTSLSVGTLLTGPITASLFYSGIFAGMWAGVFGMSSSLLLLTGTGVGTLVSLPVLLLLLGSPSYRKTIPVTLQLINIRRRVTQMMA